MSVGVYLQVMAVQKVLFGLIDAYKKINSISDRDLRLSAGWT